MAKRKRRARRPAGGLTAEIGDRIITLVRRGTHSETAAATVGISPELFRRWLARARDGGPHSSDYKRFVKAVEKAEADAETMTLSAIVQAGKEDWRALAWVLERRGPQRWNSRRAAEKKNDSKETLADLLARKLEHESQKPSDDSEQPTDPVTPIPGDPQNHG